MVERNQRKMPNNFFILSLPRSRTAWLSAFLTQSQVYCHHEAFMDIPTIKDPWNFYRSMMANDKYQYVGDSSSGCVIFYDKIKELFEGSKIVVLIRNHEAVVNSLIRLGIKFPLIANVSREIERWGCKLQELSKTEFTIRYDQLNDRNKMKQLWGYLFPDIKFDRNRFDLFMGLNIQRDEIFSNFDNYLKRCIQSSNLLMEG
jgi:hypothetical protein